jgi:site-specific DNA-methyltransferase (adenine-specific)
VPTDENLNGGAYSAERKPSNSEWVKNGGTIHNSTGKDYVQPAGRWPANVIHDGSQEVLAAFPEAPGQMAKAAEGGDRRKDQNVYGAMTRGSNGAEPREDSGSAARFFYCAKASKSDRNEGCEHLPKKPSGMVSETSGQHITRRDGGAPGPTANHHPTVKPTALMRYLCRLVTPKGGTVLDPFMGSGSTGKAAALEGFNFIGIEREAEYAAIARARLGLDPFA